MPPLAQGGQPLHSCSDDSPSRLLKPGSEGIFGGCRPGRLPDPTRALAGPPAARLAQWLGRDVRPRGEEVLERCGPGRASRPRRAQEHRSEQIARRSRTEGHHRGGGLTGFTNTPASSFLSSPRPEPSQPRFPSHALDFPTRMIREQALRPGQASELGAKLHQAAVRDPGCRGSGWVRAAIPAWGEREERSSGTSSWGGSSRGSCERSFPSSSSGLLGPWRRPPISLLV